MYGSFLGNRYWEYREFDESSGHARKYTCQESGGSIPLIENAEPSIAHLQESKFTTIPNYFECGYFLFDLSKDDVVNSVSKL